MRADEVFPSKYLKSADVKDRPRVATISHVDLEVVGQGLEAKQKAILHFAEGKPMVLNRTNWDCLEEAFGDSNEWAGHKVKIKTARTQFQGKAADGIRLEAIKPVPAAKRVDPELNDEIPSLT